MPKGISKIASSLKQLGDIHVNEWDFAELMNRDIKELEIRPSLRKLGNLRVMEWDFRTILPAVSKLAHQEVDLASFVKRTAHYKVIEWDFRNALRTAAGPAAVVPSLSGEETQALIVRLKGFLEYVTVNLIDEPSHAQIKVQMLGPDVLRFRLVLVKRDVAMLIGREGHTASAIRGLLKSAAGMHGVKALLQIHSHEEEMALIHGSRGKENG